LRPGRSPIRLDPCFFFFNGLDPCRNYVDAMMNSDWKVDEASTWKQTKIVLSKF
jgi:hypothetical protein